MLFLFELLNKYFSKKNNAENLYKILYVFSIFTLLKN